MSELEVEVRDGALWLTMNRPDRFNAFTDTLNDRLSEEVEGASTRDDVRVVLLTGAGRAFSAGADVGGENAHERFDVTSMDRANRLIRAIVGCAKPVVAAVNGVAAGVGMGTALACDLQVCRESARFVLGFASIGLMPDGGTSATVAAAVGRARAMRMALLSEPLGARAAYDAGLVSHCVADEDFDAEVARVVGTLASGPPLAYAATKKAVNAAAVAQLEQALERERSGQAVLMRTSDVVEGMRSFGEKRRPHFTGE